VAEDGKVLAFNPLTPTGHMGTAIKHPVPDQVKPAGHL